MYNFGFGSTGGLNPQFGSIADRLNNQYQYNMNNDYSQIGTTASSFYPNDMGSAFQNKGGLGAKVGGLLGKYAGPIGMGLGGIAGAFNAYHQAREERNAIKSQNKQIGKAITGLESSKANLINRTTGATNTLMNQYAMSNDPNKAQGYMGMYGSQLGGMHQGVDSADKSIAGLRTQIQSVPTKDSMWSSAFTGALGGIFGVGNMFAQNDQRKYYQDQYNKLR
jgi:hypothetical protein